MKLRHRLLQRGYLAYSRISRGMTLGVRAMLLRDGAVILVEHSYVPGWHFPGGGVEVGESFDEALRRETAEEAGAALTGPAGLFGLYRNSAAGKRDHVALFVCRDWRDTGTLKVPNREIVACRPFPADRLPEATTPGTRRRVAEVLSGGPPAEDW